MKLCTTEKEDFIRAARVWAEQSRFSLATAITQQRYFQAIIEPEVWARIEKDTGLTTTFEQCIVLVEAVFIESCSPFIRKCGFFSATHGDKEWSDYAESLLSLARLAVLKDMSEKDHMLHKLLCEIPGEMRLQLYNTHLSPTFKHLMAAFRAAEQEKGK